MTLKAYLKTKTLVIASAFVIGVGGAALAYNALTSDGSPQQGNNPPSQQEETSLTNDSTSGGNATKKTPLTQAQHQIPHLLHPHPSRVTFVLKLLKHIDKNLEI